MASNINVQYLIILCVRERWVRGWVYRLVELWVYLHVSNPDMYYRGLRFELRSKTNRFYQEYSFSLQENPRIYTIIASLHPFPRQFINHKNIVIKIMKLYRFTLFSYKPRNKYRITKLSSVTHLHIPWVYTGSYKPFDVFSTQVCMVHSTELS
jgi:hypothetical protein